MSERDIRKLLNTKENSISTIDHYPGSRNVPEGQFMLAHPHGKPVRLYKKLKGMLWWINLTRDGNEYVDKSLIVNTLKYKRSFIDYRFIVHNFNDDIGTAKVYIPWYSLSEQPGMNTSPTSFLAPFKMTLHKLYIRPETLTGPTSDLALELVKQDDGDVTVDSVATFTYTSTLVNDTLITINRSDWNVSPTIEAGDKVGLSVQASIDPSGAIDWYVTSVWEMEIII